MKRITLNSTPHRRSGFSLIELLMVVVIIGILVSILLPAISRVRVTAQIKAVAAELTQLDAAITKFNSDFGLEPYSELILTEDPATTAWPPASITRIRRVWPQFNFGAKIDFNADGAFTGDSGSDALIRITGSESLVFFLGGVKNRDANANGTVDAAEAAGVANWIGFSRNPVNPFMTNGTNRVGPYFTFDVGRMVDTDSDGMMEYLDDIPGQKTPLYFASSNNGQGYDPTVPLYVQADGRTPWNKDSHQIISPGFDSQFFDPPAIPANAIRSIYSNTTDLRTRRNYESMSSIENYEVDNIANFKPGGTLEN